MKPPIDPWHFPRPALGQDYLARFDPGSAEAIALFAVRRSGKTTFLKNDLAPVAIKAGLQPVYLDLWTNRSNPGEALAAGLEQAARMLESPGHKYGGLLGHVSLKSAHVGVAGVVSAGFTKADEPNAPKDTLSRIGYWATRMMAACDRPVLLMVDEIQALANVADGSDVSSALRSVLQQHGRMALRPVFTGSSRDGLTRMFALHRAAFYQYGSLENFPMPGLEFVTFMAARFKSTTGLTLDPPALAKAYDAMHNLPGPFREMLSAMERDHSIDVDRYMERQIGIQGANAAITVKLATLRAIDRALCEYILFEGTAYTSDANQYLSDVLGQEAPVNNKLVGAALSRLRESGLVVHVGRGQYRIENPLLADAIAARVTDIKFRERPRKGLLSLDANCRHEPEVVPQLQPPPPRKSRAPGL